MARAGSDIRAKSSGSFAQIKFMLGAAITRSGSFFGHFDRELRTIGFGEPGLVLESRGNAAVTDLVGIAELVELEQFGRQRLAAGVALALVLIDVDFQFSGHSSVPL